MSKRLERGSEGIIESQKDSIMPIKMSEDGRQKVDGMKAENLKTARQTTDIERMESISKTRDVLTLKALASNPNLPEKLIPALLGRSMVEDIRIENNTISFDYTSPSAKLNESEVTEVLWALLNNTNQSISSKAREIKNIKSTREDNIKVAPKTNDIAKITELVRSQDVSILRALASNPNLPAESVPVLLGIGGIEKDLSDSSYLDILRTLLKNTNPQVALRAQEIDNAPVTNFELKGATHARSTVYTDLKMKPNIPLHLARIISCTSSEGGQISNCGVVNGQIMFDFITPDAEWTILKIQGIDRKGRDFSIKKRIDLR